MWLLQIDMSTDDPAGVPSVGDEFATPVNGGQGWLSLGTVVNTTLIEDDDRKMTGAVLTVRIDHDRFTDVAFQAQR